MKRWAVALISLALLAAPIAARGAELRKERRFTAWI
jgi:hypothetical protein